MKNKRGQASLEFLLTYGWAILIIIVIALVLWQMGMFNLGGRVQPGSSGFWGVSPETEFAYRENGDLQIALGNRVGGNITINAVNVTVQGETFEDYPGLDIPIGGKTLWSTTTKEMAAGAQYRIFVSIAYTDKRTNEEYLSSGWIWGNVEKA